MRKFVPFFAIVLLSSSLCAQTINKDALDGTLILKVKPEYSLDFVAEVSGNELFKMATRSAKVARLYQSFKGLSEDLDHYLRLDFENISETNQLISKLTSLPYIASVERYPLLTIDNVPNDLKPQQWHLPIIKAPQAWLLQLGSSDITVAVSDNAILSSHPDLNGVMYQNAGEIENNGIDDDNNGYTDDYNGFDVADNDPNPGPPSDGLGDGEADLGWTHGTNTSGLVGANTNNIEGIASIGYGIRILPVKSTRSSGGSYFITHGYESIVYAAIMGADVVNMSWSGIGYSSFSRQVVREAFSQGVVLISSAGNDDDSTPHYPAAFDEVIGVGATNYYDEKASFSSFGSWVDVMAPGDMLYTTSHSSDLQSDIFFGYTTFSGTSASAPVVAGLAGLVKSFSPGMTASELMQYIIDGCDNIDGRNPDYTAQLGAGRVNAERSLMLAGARLLAANNDLQVSEPWNIYQRANKVVIELPDLTASFVLIVDMQGRTVHYETCNQRNIEIPLKNQGLHVVRILGENGRSRTAKFYFNPAE